MYLLVSGHVTKLHCLLHAADWSYVRVDDTVSGGEHPVRRQQNTATGVTAQRFKTALSIRHNCHACSPQREYMIVITHQNIYYM